MTYFTIRDIDFGNEEFVELCDKFNIDLTKISDVNFEQNLTALYRVHAAFQNSNLDADVAYIELSDGKGDITQVFEYD